MASVSFLDVWTPPVQEEVRRVAPAGWQLAFADRWDADHQRALARTADALVPGFAPVDEDLLAGAPRVRVVQKWGVGIDKIDLPALQRRGIALAIAPGSNAGPVAELALALMLAVYRRIPEVDRRMRRGQWPNPQMRETCMQIAGKTIGLLGFGHIGRMLARRLQGFDAEVLYTDPVPADEATERKLRARAVGFDELLQCSDILSLHLPLTPQTRHMISAPVLRRMKPGAVLINTARGGLVDEAALLGALSDGHLLGAGLDAFDPEPPLADNPLFALDCVVLTPHAGGGVFDNVAPVARRVFANVACVLDGRSLPASDLVLGPAVRSPA